MALKFERKLPIVLAFVVVMLATVGYVFYQSTVSAKRVIAWQRHSQDIVYRLDRIPFLSLESEAAVRGFVTVGSDTYLEPHRMAETQIRSELAYLRQRFGSHQPQLEELGRLEAFVSQYFFEASRKIESRVQNGADVAMLEISPQKTKPAIDAIRASADKLKAEEASLLARRERNLDNRLYRTILILIISTFAGVGALVLASVMVTREIKKRQAVETELVEVNHNLEEKVSLRTNELEKANTVLIGIGGEREELLRKEQEARREAEIANRLRDEFMATVSHELRTPLNSILGWARLMKDGGLTEAQNEKAVATIIRSSENQNRLIEDLLDVARLISGKLDLVREPVALPTILEHTAESLRPLAAAKDVRIEIQETLPAEECKVIGDRHRLTQVFSNLIENAVKFSNSGGTVSLSLREDNGVVNASVRDDGAGISKEFLPSVFERFRQDPTPGVRNGGLGLGLAIVRNLVELHRGSVAVSSEGEGKGAEFTVSLPLLQDKHPAVGPIATSRAGIS